VWEGDDGHDVGEQPVVRIRLFGGVSAATDDGEQVSAGAARTQTVLAALAISPGVAVPAARLVDLVWGDDPPATAAKTLQWHIAQLRKSLGMETIARIGAAYRLDVAGDAVDVARFQRHLRAGDVDAALAEWTGEPLAGLDAPGLSAAVEGLTEQWLGAVEASLSHRAQTGPQAVIGPLTELTARYPFREGLWAALITALYQTGRQHDALAAYRSARRRLAEELGAEPGPRLRELESQILNHDERLGPHSPIRTDRSRRGNLPQPLDSLISRDAELTAIGLAIGRSPLVTLVGPGGMGKTRLALAAARAAAERGWGAWLVELAELTAPGDVPRAVADALGVTEHQGLTLTQSVVSVLRSRAETLLIVDNCEHVMDGAAGIIRAIIERCPRVRVLATSRERLALTGEELIEAGPLDPGGAGAELFEARALAVDPAFDRQAHRADVETICRRLDGIPLAIELAAARTRSLAPPDLLARLDTSFRLIYGSERASPKRHQTLRATFQWSYDLLTPPEQELLRRLSVFAGPFSLSAAENVGRTTDAGVIVSSLVDRSMLLATAGPFGRRFRFLETTRQFAAGHLRDSGQAGQFAQRHALWCLGEVTHLHGLLTGPAEIEGVARLSELWPSLRSAVDWACVNGDPGLAHELSRPVATEIALRGRHEIADWAVRILAATASPDEDVHAFWLLWAAERYQQNGNHEGYERLVGLSRRAG
jgi:predicted ATPase/DNA-binding SARP family transcriptional activator